VEQTLSILKNHLEKRLPSYIGEHLPDIFEGKKFELDD
jgi:hypothetical protein